MSMDHKKTAQSKKKPKIVKLTLEQQVKLTAVIRESNLDQDISALMVDLIYGNRWLVENLEKGLLSIAKMRKLFNITTEKSSSRRNKANNRGASTEKHSPIIIDADTGLPITETSNYDDNNLPIVVIKGHGRNAADAYSGANVIYVKLDELKPGDICPAEYCDGRLYELGEPGVIIRIVGSPMAQATRYDLQKLRCSICEIIYTAPLPDSAGGKKYAESFVAMLMINKYFMSVPLYRQEVLQNYLGVPLPSSTQYELMQSYEAVLKSLYEAFIVDASTAKGFSIDDTKAKILEQIAINKKADKKSDKKSCYTTGIVSVHDDHMSYIFVTDNQTAGKSIAPILNLRPDNLPIPYVMCDALTANIPENISADLYILCYCLVHARRQFYELPDGYDDLSDKVIALIGKIYDNENITKGMINTERLKYHQEHSQSIIDELKEYLISQKNEFEPNGVAGQAIDYILKRWTELTQFLRHQDAPLDTNITERALKLIIQVRKSSMFYKTLNSAKFASYVQTALYSAAQNDVNPCVYMENILIHKERVIDNPNAWLPWNYHKTLESLEDGNAFHGSSINPGLP